MTKKVLSLLLALAMVFALAACRSNDDPAPGGGDGEFNENWKIGIITGTTGTTLSPKSTTTRAQVAVMLHRYLTD